MIRKRIVIKPTKILYKKLSQLILKIYTTESKANRL